MGLTLSDRLTQTDKEKMKLTVALLAAVAESKPKKPKGGKFHQAKEVTNGDSKVGHDYQHHVPALECPADMIASIVNDDGISGTVSMEDHGNHEHCFVNLGEPCGFGVEVEITHMKIESAYSYFYDDPEYEFQCYDAVFFAHTHNGEQHKTTQQCGCVVDDGDDCTLQYSYTYYGYNTITNDYEYELYETGLPTKYTLAGDDTKMVFHSDSSIDGGSIVVDWKCYVPPGNMEICPSTKCYTQDQGWKPGRDISCKMTNPDCLNVSY